MLDSTYDAAIDGAYGRGTRSSMRAWQEANNHEPTGILTTRQRAELLAAYNAVLDGMNLQLVRDDASGIEIMIPTGVVAFSEYEPPFARFEPKGDIDAKVLLIAKLAIRTVCLGFMKSCKPLRLSLRTARARAIILRLKSKGQATAFTPIFMQNSTTARSRALA